MCGAGADSARAAVVRSGASAVVHVGFAGGLDPALARGDLALVEAIEEEDGVVPVAPSALARRLLERAGVRGAVLRSSPTPLDRAGKRRLAAVSKAALVDMESAAARAACRELGIPWTGLRVVSDALDDELPRAVIEAFDGRGFRLTRILGALLARPALARELGVLARRSREHAEILAAALDEAW